MASSSITLAQTIDWAKRFLFRRPLNLGNYNEPAVTSANLILQTILGAPFAWRWNRATVTFTTVAGQQDYFVNSTNTFGWIENASIQETNQVSGLAEWKQITPHIDLALESGKARPHSISAQFNDTNGNITFRLMPCPDKAYPVTVQFQQKPPVLDGTESTWSPIPDEYSRLYNWGFLALMYMYADDPRFQLANQKFVTNLLSTAEGLTETEMNIWLNNWEQVTGTPIEKAANVQQGRQGRIGL
jgi:hypothetical protein